MRLFIDQDVYASTIALVRKLGHDVVHAADAGMSRAADLVLLQHAARERRVLLTRDLGFGHLVHLAAPGTSSPVIILRADPGTLASVHDELRVVLDRHSEADLAETVVVVAAHRHRIRRLADP